MDHKQAEVDRRYPSIDNHERLLSLAHQSTFVGGEGEFDYSSRESMPPPPPLGPEAPPHSVAENTPTKDSSNKIYIYRVRRQNGERKLAIGPRRYPGKFLDWNGEPLEIISRSSPISFLPKHMEEAITESMEAHKTIPRVVDGFHPEMLKKRQKKHSRRTSTGRPNGASPNPPIQSTPSYSREQMNYIAEQLLAAKLDDVPDPEPPRTPEPVARTLSFWLDNESSAKRTSAPPKLSEQPRHYPGATVYMPNPPPPPPQLEVPDFELASLYPTLMASFSQSDK